jgi:hypothetical protein
MKQAKRDGKMATTTRDKLFIDGERYKKRNETKSTKTKRNEINKNETKRNEINEMKTK